MTVSQPLEVQLHEQLEVEYHVIVGRKITTLSTDTWWFGIGVLKLRLYPVLLLAGKLIVDPSSFCLLSLNPSHPFLS